MNDWGETVGRAARVRDDMMLGRVILFVVHTHNDGDVFVLTRGRDKDFLRAGVDMTFGLGGFGEEPSRFDHDLHPQLLPRKGRRTLGLRETLYPMAIDDEQVIVNHILARFGAFHFAIEAALDGIVLLEISEIVGRDEIVYGHHIHFLAQESLVTDCSKDESADASEAVDTDLNHSAVAPLRVGIFLKRYDRGTSRRQ